MPDASQTTIAPKFYAAIAYVPDEFIWCDWLHRQLNDTPVPPSLAGQRTRHGFARPSILRIFPDPRDPVHIARSSGPMPECRHLIVVCSPQSARSPELDEKIRAFKKSESEDRIIVFVVDADAHHAHERAEAAADWVPAWLRWRLDEKGNFRHAEASEPLIIDARTGQLTLPEARAQLLGALLDVPRDELRAYDDLVTLEAAATLAAPEMDLEEPGPAKAARSGAAWLRIAAVFLLAGAGAAIWWKLPSLRGPTVDTVAAESASTGEPLQISASPGANPALAQAAVPSPQAVASTSPKVSVPVAMPEPKGEATPVPMPTVITSVALPSPPEPKPEPAATPVPEPPRSPAPAQTGAVAFAPSDGPQTPIRSAPKLVTRPLTLTGLSEWRRMRDLGDTLLDRGNRDAGMIALAQATEIALKAADGSNAAGEKLEIARMCFRVGALQKRYFTPKESQRTLAGGLRILERMPRSAEDADERAALMENLTQLLKGSGE